MIQITDEGLCCSFNTMPEAVMFKNEAVKVGALCNTLHSSCQRNETK